MISLPESQLPNKIFIILKIPVLIVSKCVNEYLGGFRINCHGGHEKDVGAPYQMGTLSRGAPMQHHQAASLNHNHQIGQISLYLFSVNTQLCEQKNRLSVQC